MPTKFVICDLCKATHEWPMPPNCGWFGVSLYRMGAKTTRHSTIRVKGGWTLCPQCVVKLPFGKELL